MRISSQSPKIMWHLHSVRHCLVGHCPNNNIDQGSPLTSQPSSASLRVKALKWRQWFGCLGVLPQDKNVSLLASLGHECGRAHSTSEKKTSRLADLHGNPHGVDFDTSRSRLFIQGVDFQNRWSRYFDHLAWVESIIACFEYIILNQSRERKSTPRDLIVEPLARILRGNFCPPAVCWGYSRGALGKTATWRCTGTLGPDLRTR
jgi:hypothetical protein